MNSFSNRELACVEAALTYWRREGLSSSGHERGIATRGGAVRELAAEEVDTLIKRLAEPPETTKAVGKDAQAGGRLLEVLMQDVIGEYDTPSGPEWQWVERNASYQHCANGQAGGIWEFVLNLGAPFEYTPSRLAPTIDQARKAGFAYVLFHQGT